MHRLQQALSQSKSEVQAMAAKLHRLEILQGWGAAAQVKDYMAAFVDLGDKAEYIHFLEQELDQERFVVGSGLHMHLNIAALHVLVKNPPTGSFSACFLVICSHKNVCFEGNVDFLN